MTQLSGERTRPLTLLQYVVYGGAIMYFGRDLFIPLCFGLLVSFILYPVCRWMEKRGLKRVTAVFLSTSLLVIVATLLIFLLTTQLLGFLQEWPALKGRILAAGGDFQAYLSTRHNVSAELQEKVVRRVLEQSFGWILPVLKALFSASAFSLLMLILVPIYAVLLLVYRRHWVAVLGLIFPGKKKHELTTILSLAIVAYYDFFKGMALVYLVVGILNTTGLLLLGIPHAILFGFLVAILTFIPYIGIIVGSLLPITMAWITYDSVWYPLGVVGIFAFVQYLEANLIFPLAISRKLHINTLMILIAIFLGGILWGVAGMILFIPFASILKLIADQDPELHIISKLMDAPQARKKAPGNGHSTAT